MATTSNTPADAIDGWDRARRIMGPTNGAGVAVVVALAAPLWHIPAWAPLLPGLAGAAIRVVRHLRRDPDTGALGFDLLTRTVVYRAVCWVAPALWACLTIAGMPLALAAGTIIAAVIVAEGASAWCDPPPVVVPPLTPEQRAAAAEIRTPETVAWVPRINRLAKITAPGVTIADVQQWPNDSGFTLHGAFPPESGHLFTEIRDVAPKLGSAGALPGGCMIQVGEGLRGQASFAVEVPTRDYLVAPVPWHGDLTPKSVTDGLQVVKRQTAEWLLLYPREQASVAVGRRGTGKTTLLLGIASELCRCTDSLTWVIDMNRGALALPLIGAFARGEAQVPGVDWLAATAEEALLLAQIAYHIALYRKDAYEYLKYEMNTSLLPISRNLPMLNILVDEGAEFGGDGATVGLSERDRKYLMQARELLMKTLRIGRDAGVNVHFTGLRGVAAVLPQDVLTQSSLRMCLKTETEDEIAYTLGWANRLQPRFLTARGMMYLRQDAVDGDIPPDRVRAMDITRHQLREVELRTQHIRPTLDEDSLDIAREFHPDRWRRNSEILDRLAGPNGWTPVDVGRVTVIDMGGAVALTERPTDPDDQDTPDLEDSEQHLIDDLRALYDASPDEGDPDGGATYVHPADDPDTDPDTDEAASRRDARRAYIEAQIRQAGPTGMRLNRLLELLADAGYREGRDTVTSDLNYLIGKAHTVERYRKGLYKATD